MIEAAIAFAFGLLIGSFLNVCVHRWPRGLSVVRPRSFCTSCESQIAWYDNIPVFSYLVLTGKCRHCGARIALRYPALELATALLFALAAYRYGLSLPAIEWACFSALILGLMAADLEQRILPDPMTLGGIALGLMFALLVPLDSTFGMPAGAGPGLRSLFEAAIGAVIPSGMLWVVGELYYRIRGREGLGLGDVKMLGMIGTFVGLPGALLTLVLGSVAGAVAGVCYIILLKKDAASYELPLGLFLGLGALTVTFFGPAILGWYLGLGA